MVEYTETGQENVFNWEEFIVGEDYDAFLITKKENYEE